jgi:type I restriction enzyme M protein
MPAPTTDIVQKLWNLCHVLRDDGVVYQQYVTELVYLLFLKMAQETEREGEIPPGYRWKNLVDRDGLDQLTFYKKLLLDLGSAKNLLLQTVYADATTALRKPQSLKRLVDSIDALDWFSAEREKLGELYEGLLEKNAGEVKSGAGQYFTPRPLVEAIIDVVRPKAGETLQDPACGTGGFLIHADQAIKRATDQLFDLNTAQQEFQRSRAYVGIELVPETRRLALMNMLLHDIQCDVHAEDSLSSFGAKLPKADVILTNPPFGTKQGGGRPTRDDFTFPTSNKQLAFLQHIYRGLKPGGRAAVVLPDNVLFEDNAGVEIRRDLMEKCDLHTILRLPTGIFYAQGVKTNVLFFTRGASDKGGTKNVWIYDYRTNVDSFGKRTPLTRAHFDDFVRCFGSDPRGQSPRTDSGESGRWRVFSREVIAKRGDNLDITWLKDESAGHHEVLAEPEVIAAEIVTKLESALEEMRGLQAALEGGA